jgi:DNA repair protein RecO (recombination protein O)
MRSRVPAPPRAADNVRGADVSCSSRDVRRGGHTCATVQGKFKTEAIVLRSIRYGEADRVLHLFSANRGRVNAIAKGVRRPRSRFGGRLEPFFRLDLILHQGRSDLCTVTAAHTVDAHPNLRADGPALGAAARGCDAVLRLCDAEEANPGAYNLLCRYLTILDGSESTTGDGSGDGAVGLATALAFRIKLVLATGFSPELASCARCGEADGLTGFSGAAGGVVCAACERGGFPLSAEAHAFMVEALGNPLARAPSAGERALRQVERAIAETVEHHASVQLRAAA